MAIARFEDERAVSPSIPDVIEPYNPSEVRNDFVVRKFVAGGPTIRIDRDTVLVTSYHSRPASEGDGEEGGVINEHVVWLFQQGQIAGLSITKVSPEQMPNPESGD